MGEHLPCKQGVMSSNLTISIRKPVRGFPPEVPEGTAGGSYLENRIQNKQNIGMSGSLIGSGSRRGS